MRRKNQQPDFAEATCTSKKEEKPYGGKVKSAGKRAWGDGLGGLEPSEGRIDHFGLGKRGGGPSKPRKKANASPIEKI